MAASTRTTAPKITSAATWNTGAAGVVTELPSGKHVLLVRKLDLPLMLKSGRIPNPLARVIRDMIAAGKSEIPAEDMQDEAVFTQMMDMVDMSVVAAMVEPKALRPPVKGRADKDNFGFQESEEEYRKRVIAFEEILNDPEANTISTDWIELPDKMFIFFFSQGGAADLATFRTATSNALAALSASGAVEVPSE